MGLNCNPVFSQFLEEANKPTSDNTHVTGKESVQESVNYCQCNL